MRRTLLCAPVLIAALATSARAGNVVAIKSGGELPADLVADLDSGVLRTSTGEVRIEDFAPIDVPPEACGIPQYVSATYDRKAHALVVDERECGAGKISIARTLIIARLAASAGRRAETRGELAVAKRELEAALTGEPAGEATARVLARVLLAQGDRAGAAAALRPFIDQAPVAHYAEYVANPVLAPLVDEAPLAGLRAPTPGTARIDGAGTLLLARSARLDLIAIVRDVPLGDGDWGRGDRWAHAVVLDVFDPRGQVVATLALADHPGDLHGVWNDTDLIDVADDLARRLDAANRLLRDLGFDPIGDGEIASFAYKQQTGTLAASWPRARLGLAVRDGTARLLVHDRVIDEHVIFKCGTDPTPFNCEYLPTFEWAAWLPGQHLVVVVWDTSGAEHRDRDANLEVWQVPSP